MKRLPLLLATALAPVIWGSTYIVTTEFLPADKPYMSAFIRAFPAGIILILISRSYPRAREWGKIILLSALNITIFQAALFIAAYRLPGGIAAVIGTIQPLIVIWLIWVMDKKAPSSLTILGCISCIVGMSLLLLTPAALAELDALGVIAAFTGAVCMGLGTFLAKKWTFSISITGFSGWQLFLGSLMLLPVAAYEDLPLPALTAEHIVSYVYLSVIGAVVAYFLWFNGVKKLSAVAVSVLGLLSPLTAALSGWFFLNESMSFISLLGFVIVLTSILLVQKSVTD
ncbi:EamA family transporter [Endozoicomonas sp. 4G]|uniref:EamA family transporter n=1 Tax=Endozoicomonas sp. 4G TaxID=2872754 RepID=UPI0020787C8F|nr:EamA family transporter [Endozoicomonas sp. 4G]